MVLPIKLAPPRHVYLSPHQRSTTRLPAQGLLDEHGKDAKDYTVTFTFKALKIIDPLSTTISNNYFWANAGEFFLFQTDESGQLTEAWIMNEAEWANLMAHIEERDEG